jgi:type II secretory pathway pseudopilin PulG
MKVKTSAGLTLIELIVVITIIIMFSGMSLAAYFNFSQNQASTNDARSFVTILRRVQAMSRNLVFPADCTGLRGYRIFDSCDGVYDKNCQSISANAICGGGEIPVIEKEKILSEAYFSGHMEITFIAGTGKITSPTTFSIANINNIVISIDENGNAVTK